MVDHLASYQQVYAKWERKSAAPSLRQGAAGSDAQQLSSSQFGVPGRQAWQKKFGASIGAPPDRARFKPRRHIQREPVYALPNLAEFKIHPTIQPNHGVFHRPFMGRCCTCLPKSRSRFFDQATPSLGIRSILNVPTSSLSNSILVRLFCHIVFTARQPVDFKYPDVTKKVLSSQRIFSATHLTVRKEFQGRSTMLTQKSFIDNMKKCKTRATRILSDMQAVMRLPLIKFTGWFLLKVLGLLLDSIQVHNGQLQMLQEAAMDTCPVIYIPLHKSHMDYVLMTFILWNYRLRGPYVAAGDNMNIPLFGPLLRSLGGFFIRRRLDAQYGEKDILYRAVLQQYVEELLRAGQAIEFFIEGGRTRSGKALAPKAGLLSIVVEAFNGGAIDDAYIVPVSISYEKILDGDFNREQLGLPKVKESFWRTVKGLWRVFTSTYGSVRVDFCQPFSLQEYISRSPPMSVTSRQPPCLDALEPGGSGNSGGGRQAIPLSPLSRSRDDDEGWWEEDDDGSCGSVGGGGASPKPLLSSRCRASTAAASDAGVTLSTASLDSFPRVSSATSMTSIYGIDESDDQKAFISRLAKHVIYSCVSATAIMSTNVLAFVFVFVHRKGATLSQLVQSFDSVRDEITAAGRDLGFRGSSDDIIMHALELVGEAMISCTDDEGRVLRRKSLSSEQLNSVRLVPALQLPVVFEWTYYSNPVISVFEKECIIANAIWASVEDDLSLTLDDPCADDLSAVTVNSEAVLSKAALLCDLLQFEFFFRPPCVDLEKSLEEALEDFVTKEIVLPCSNLRAAGSVYSQEETQWAMRYSSHVSWDNEEGEEAVGCNGHLTGSVGRGGSSNSQEYYVNVTKTDCMRRLQFYRKLMLSYIEAYCCIISSLTEQLKEKDVAEDDFIRETQAELIDRVTKGITDYGETASHDVLKNALRAVDALGLTDAYTAAGVRMVTLHDRYQSEERLLELVELLQSCYCAAS